MSSLRYPVLAALAIASFCRAGAESSEPGTMAYAVAGTGGLGGGLGYHFNDTFTVRGELADFKYNYDTTRDGVVYEGHLKLSTQAVYLDWHPGGESYRLTIGLDLGRTGFGGSAVANQGGTIDIDGETFNYGPGDHLRANIRYKRFKPYIGVGWGLNGKGFNFGADLGINYGSADVALDISENLYHQAYSAVDGSVIDQAKADALAAQYSSYRRRFDSSWFPIAKISIGYSF